MGVSFNGTSSQLTWSGNLVSSFPITIFGWVKPTSASVSQMVFGVADFGADDELMLFADGASTGKMRAFARRAGGSAAADSAASIVTTWQPVMVVFLNASNRTVYYAGGAAGNNTTAMANVLSTHDRFVIGSRGKDNTLYFAGDVAEVAVWSAELGATEWADLAAGDFPETIAPGSLVEHWALENSSDLVGSVSRTLTANNVTSAADHPIVRASDTTAPTLSSPTGTATGATTATGTVSTDEGNGTLYAVVTTSATAPSEANVKAGNDHTGTAAAFAVGSGAGQAVSATGTQNVSATGLTGSTAYYWHYMHEDAATNRSSVATSASFTTSAPAENPVITGQPSNATVKTGQTAQFSVTATGSGTVTYQWQVDTGGGFSDMSNGGGYSDVTTATLSIVTTRAMNGYQYRCNVSDDDAGPVATNAATLTVNQAILALSGAGYEFGDGNSAATMSVLASTELQVAAYPVAEWPPATAVASVTATTAANGRLADLADDDLVFGTTYRVIARNAADGETWAWTMAAS